ncbi:DUF554 domain-containing protein [Zhenhengia yiwuensis]|uniref:DUF554 domain-containing protein n=1 Tax=Zhenhengia yiwuensis TaxID=2763666 RepID=UPI002A75F059|nr:DUF554 domain-containing protein [Zhenhengia yiwuensis]MDY3368730.1 DUF554 domain-containing protein [Zhenhengia yiwuensis]
MLLGTLVNVALVLIGGFVGLFLKKGISKRFSDLIMNAIALVTMVIGITFATASENMLVVIISLVVGALMGEGINIDKKLNQLGGLIKSKVKSESGNVGEGFVTATLLFCVGSMAIMGSLDSGLRGDHTVLYTKAIMDGISALIFASSMGIGVLLSAVPILLYQGSITLLSSFIQPYLTQSMMTEMNAVGGILLIGLGISILGIKEIKVSNLLPALVIPVILLALIG